MGHHNVFKRKVTALNMLKEKIEKFYLERRKDRDRTYFYITEAGRCPRSVWYNFKKFPKKEKDARVMRVFENGDMKYMEMVNNDL